MVELGENEYRTLSATEKLEGKASIEQITRENSLSYTKTMRAALTLKQKNLVRIVEKKQTIIWLNHEGRKHAEKGLPERRMAKALMKLGGISSIVNTVKMAELEKKLVPIALGWLRRKKMATLDPRTNMLQLAEPTKHAGIDEKLLGLLREKGKIDTENLSSEMLHAAETLKRRKLLDTDEKVKRTIEITPSGWKKIRKGAKVVAEVNQLTPELIITGNWRASKLTEFDVTLPGPVIHPAKLHPVQQAIQTVKQIFAEMGFAEIRGPIVETAFWNFDALFQPQDHPAREMQDTFYLEYPQTGRLPEKTLVKNVAKTHENGWKTGSKGWQYPWSTKVARKLVFRTHTTATTIRYLAQHKEPPVKVFSVDHVYRNEKMDYKSLAEFYQIEGIIMDKNVTLRDLIGTLTEFYLRLGLEKVRFWPSYFPYTEPSAQSTVYIPELKKWFELCGMGMFRPEVLAPLGIKHPVLAWGGGLERLIMLKLHIDDIRFLYKNDLNWIRRTPTRQ